MAWIEAGMGTHAHAVLAHRTYEVRKPVPVMRPRISDVDGGSSHRGDGTNRDRGNSHSGHGDSAARNSHNRSRRDAARNTPLRVPGSTPAPHRPARSTPAAALPSNRNARD